MKFKVGDKVVPVDKSFYGPLESSVEWKNAIEIEQPYLFVNSIEDKKIICHHENIKPSNGDFFASEDLKLYKPKPTKNQRITVLEKEVDELKVIVEQLRKANITIEDVKEHLGVTSTVVSEDKPKTPNQLRAEIIEKAKGFVEGKFFEGNHGVGGVVLGRHGHNWVEFVINYDKRTIVALLRLAYVPDNRVMLKGIAKCNPSDVFNEHIGKAIALGRALGLDVSEFEQAVQPNEVVVGHVATHKNSNIHYTISSINGDTYLTKPGGHYTKGSFTKGSAYIVNDTNAIYESEVE